MKRTTLAEVRRLEQLEILVDEAVSEAFLAARENLDVIVTLRREKGHDIDPTGGQLRLKTERELTRIR